MTGRCIAARCRAGVLALALLAACSTSGTHTDTGASRSPLPGTSWRLAELHPADDPLGVARPDDPAMYEMTLDADGAAALRLDCNRGSGRWVASATSEAEGTITFASLAVTRAACPPGSLDTRVSRELEFVRTYVIEGDRLTLIMIGDGGNQVWTRVR